MNVLEINKYPPSLFRDGRFLHEDWTSCTDIGSVRSGRTLTREDYLLVEARYVRAIRRFMGAAGVVSLAAVGIEAWDDHADTLRAVGLSDVLDDTPRPVEGLPILDGNLDNVIRRCLREVAWMELVVEQRFLVHFGYDLCLKIGGDFDAVGATAETRADGLFVYPSRRPLTTIDRWNGRR